MSTKTEFVKIVSISKNSRLVVAYRKVHSSKLRKPYIIFQGLKYEIEPIKIFWAVDKVLGLLPAVILNPFGIDIAIKSTSGSGTLKSLTEKLLREE